MYALLTRSTCHGLYRSHENFLIFLDKYSVPDVNRFLNTLNKILHEPKRNQQPAIIVVLRAGLSTTSCNQLHMTVGIGIRHPTCFS